MSLSFLKTRIGAPGGGGGGYWSHDIMIPVLLMQGKVELTLLKSSMPAMKVFIVPVYSHMVITFCRLPLYFGNL